MKYPLFTIPRVRGLASRVSVRADSSLGSVNEHFWPPEANTTSMQRLVLHWSGLLRALTLAGYRAVELFVEAEPATATRQLLLDMTTWGLASVDPRPDGLDDARGAGAPLLVALTIDPLQPFGDPGGALLALPLPAGELGQIAGVHAVVSETERGWLAFTCDEAGLWDAMDGLTARAMDVAGRLASDIASAWFAVPGPLAGPAGLGWLFDSTGWWFPPRPPDRPDEDARILASALGAVSEAFSGAIDLDDFLATALVRDDDPHLFDAAGNFGRVTRDWTPFPADAPIGAYVRRVSGLASPNSGVAASTAADIDRKFTWVDAVLTMIEHGAVAVGHRLLPSHPETSLGPNAVFASTPEWTTPQLTGQWDATASRDTIILNQAGDAINGHWQQRVGSSLHHYVIDGTKVSGDREGGPLTYAVKIWDQPDVEQQHNVDDELGPLRDGDANIEVSQPSSGIAALTLVAAVGGSDTARTFTRSPLGGQAHHTAWTLNGLPEVVRERFLRLRDAPLHYAEIVFVERLIARAVEYVERFIEEEPSTVALESMMTDFRHALEDDMRIAPGTNNFDRFTDNDELMVRARFYVTATLLEIRPAGGDSHLTVLKAMFRATFRTTLWLQEVYGLPILEVPDGAYFRYRWKLYGINMIGGAYVVGAAVGTGTFELQRVDVRGQAIGPLISRTIDLKTIEGGMVYGPIFGPDDIDDWKFFDPTYRDITPHLDGAEFSMLSMGASWLAAKSSSSIEVLLGPTDGLPPVTGRIDGALLEPDFLDPSADPTDPADIHGQTTKAKDMVEAANELSDELNDKGLKGGMKWGTRLLKPDVSGSTTFGWLRSAAGAPRKPPEVSIDAGDYVDSDNDTWARFDTNKYDIADDFRDRIRQCLLWNLTLFSTIGELVVTGHASQDGPDDYNFRLSRDRAVAVLTAVYDILGPQLAIPLGDVRIVGKGSTEATGEPESDEAYDRRVDFSIAGSVRLRS